MRHIAMVIPTVDRIGGAERQALLLAYGLARRGWRVSLVALAGWGGDARAALARDSIAFVGLEMRKGLADPRGWMRLIRWLHREKPDLVHAHLPHAAWLARGARLVAPVRVVIDTLHSSSTGGWTRRLGYWASRWLADWVTAVGISVAQAHLKNGMASSRSLTVVPNGVDTQHWRPDAAIRQAARNELGQPDAFLWLAAGRLEVVKDYPTLLQAMVLLPEAKLLIAGSGPLELELKRMAGALGISGRVRFLGFEPDLARWMRAADGVVLSSLWEGLPMTLLEAGACSLPAVATDVPGVREVLVAESTGLLVQPQSPEALAAAMTALMSRPAWERIAMGARARLRVEQFFSLEAVLDHWEALYANLLERRPKPARWAR